MRFSNIIDLIALIDSSKRFIFFAEVEKTGKKKKSTTKAIKFVNTFFFSFTTKQQQTPKDTEHKKYGDMNHTHLHSYEISFIRYDSLG